MPELPITQPIHSVDDLASASDFERKHTPHITVTTIEGRTHITVETGYYVEHPNEPGHFFDFIDILLNDVPIAHFHGAAGLVEPQVSIVIDDEVGSMVTALASCNLHGVWKASEKITPETSELPDI